MKVVSFSVTSAGADLAARLPYQHRAGRLVESVREEWGRAGGLVIVAATGIAVRAIAPLLASKEADPAVVAVDDAGRHAVALSGGHRAGANDLARQVAALLGACPVISTATDLAGLAALDRLPGWTAEGDVAAVTRRWLDGEAPVAAVDPELRGWRLPPGLAEGPGRAGVVVTDRLVPGRPGIVTLRPRSLVIGVGTSRGADPASVRSAALAAQAVPSPSAAVEAAVGTPSVAEAAALVAAGPGGRLVRAKRVGPGRDATVAVARRAGPAGHLRVVGLGPGDPARRTAEAVAAVRRAEVVVGYSGYIDLAGDLIGPGQEVVRSPLGAEAERCRLALERAAGGQQVALVCSGDPGVYAMAGLVLELAPECGHPPVTVVAGVTAALAGAAVLGAPLGHDHASISLSDLLTPWPAIRARLEAVAAADLVVSLYNPRSGARTTQLPEALAVLGRHRAPATPAAVLTGIGRPGAAVVRTTLGGLDPEAVGMLSLVIVGSSTTRWIGGRMVTPRGYLA